MGKILDEDLIYEILSVVEEIPAGKVASYGQIARLIGWDKNSRLVGKVLSMAEFYGKYPCHRVVIMQAVLHQDGENRGNFWKTKVWNLKQMDAWI